MIRNLELGILHQGKLNESGKGVPEKNKFDSVHTGAHTNTRFKV